jgi:hypothetical protein
MNTVRRELLRILASIPVGLATTRLFANDAQNVDSRNPSAAYGDSVRYGIYRKNKRIGGHTLSFLTESNKTTVSVESRIKITVLKVPVYRFDYQSVETWKDGMLQEVTASVNDNGDKHTVAAKRSAQSMLLTDRDGNTSQSNVNYTSNHWNINVLQQDVLFNTLTGRANKVELETLGPETLTINKQAIQANHFRYAGDLDTEVWYDNFDRWVMLRFEGKDGSVIEYRSEGFLQ